MTSRFAQDWASLNPGYRLLTPGPDERLDELSLVFGHHDETPFIPAFGVGGWPLFHDSASHLARFHRRKQDVWRADADPTRISVVREDDPVRTLILRHGFFPFPTPENPRRRLKFGWLVQFK